MLKVSDFLKGDKVYILDYWINNNPSIEEAKVVSVSNGYVVVDNPWVFKFSDWNSEYHDARFLYEVGKIEKPSLLFKDKEEAEKYLIKTKLALWLGAISFDKAKNFTLEQLQKVRDILEQKQDKMIELPCKIGDTVYVILFGEIIKCEVNTIAIDENNNIYVKFGKCNNGVRPTKIYSWEFGRRAFLSEEKAKRKLKLEKR